MSRGAVHAGLAFLLSVLAWGCAATPPGESVAAVEIETILQPELNGLEPHVRERLQQALAGLDRLADAEPVKRASAYGEAGLVFHAYSFNEPAASCYRNASRLVSDEAIWPYLLGQVLVALHRDTEAIEAFERSLELDPGYQPTLVRLGDLMLRSDSLERAAGYFDAALQSGSESAAARFGRGKVALAAQQFELATRLFAETLELAPESSAVHYPLALAYRGLGDMEQAKSHLVQRGEAPPPLPDFWMQRVIAEIDGMRVHQLRGTEASRLGRYVEAKAEFEAALKAAPDSALILTNLALTLIRLEDPETAESHLRRAVELAPEDTFARYNLGTLLASRGDDAAAIAEFERTLAVDPDHTLAQINLANALCRSGHCVDAATWYERAAAAAPGNLALRVGHARALGASGRWTDAAALLEEAHRQRPDDPALRGALARVLAAAPEERVRNGRRALQIARPLLRDRPTLDEMETFAMVAAENGHFGQAVELQRQLLRSVGAASPESKKVAWEANLKRYERRIACRSPWGDVLR